MAKLTKIDKELLEQISGLHNIPQGSYNIRKNGEMVSRSSTDDIQIVSKSDKAGIDIIIKSKTVNKSVHIPVIVTQSGMNDLTYNDFYIGDNCDVLIVAGCGIHNAGTGVSSHNGIHNFKIGKNSKVRYVEKHLAVGNKGEKVISPTTKITMEANSYFEMETIQLGGVSYSNRKTSAKLKEAAHLEVKEKILTTDTQQAITNFVVELDGKDSICNVVSRSVAKDHSNQTFKSKLVGRSACFGRVECDAILIGNARVKSVPEVDACSVDASLNHEATVGKIAGEQLLKLMTMGLTEQQAEDMIIKGYLK